jgi:hypothetical protein
MAMQILNSDPDHNKLLKVTGSSRHKVEVIPHEFTALPNTDCTLKIPCVPNTTVSRIHGTNLTEISCTVSGEDFFTEQFETVSYGANPRLPVLCSTFDDIFSTAKKGSGQEDLFVLHNTGIDIFCDEAEFHKESDAVVIKFNHETHGIANGGLTTGVIRYMIARGYCEPDLQLSVRIWAIKTNSTLIESASTARNSHRELDILDRMNQHGAFDHLIKQLGDKSSSFRFKVGDQNADEDARPGDIICGILYMFTTASTEAHPVWKPSPPGGALQTFKSDGRNRNPRKGLNELKKSVNL